MASIWETRFRNHELWTVVDQFTTAAKKVKLPSDVDLADSLARLFWLGEQFGAHRAAEDVNGYTPTMLENAKRPLEGNIIPTLQQYVADPEVYSSNLRAAADQVDSVLDQMANWPPLPAKGAAIAAGQASSQFQTTASEALRELTETKDQLATDLADIKTAAEVELSDLKRAREAFESDAESQLETKLDQIIKEQLDRTEASADAVTGYEHSAMSVFEELQVMENEGRNLLEAVANKAVAQDYRKNARNKAIGGWAWDFFGLVIGGTSLTLLLVHLFDTKNDTITTSLALTRLAVSIAGLGLAALCFRRGADNHEEGRRSKRADLRLSTVRPFIANQDAEFQDVIVEGMAERIYLEGILEAEDAEHDPNVFQSALERRRKRRGLEAPTSE